MKPSIKDFFSKCKKNSTSCSHLLKKSLKENFIFCAVDDCSLKVTNIKHGFIRMYIDDTV